MTVFFTQAITGRGCRRERRRQEFNRKERREHKDKHAVTLTQALTARVQTVLTQNPIFVIFAFFVVHQLPDSGLSAHFQDLKRGTSGVTFSNMNDRIEFNPRVCGGRPVIQGARIPVEVILGQLAEAESWEALLRGYPELTRVDIQATLRFAASGGREPRQEDGGAGAQATGVEDANPYS